MIIISYDISNDKLRTKFSKFLTKYGVKVQLSIVLIENETKVYDKIVLTIKKTYLKKLKATDSIMIHPVNKKSRFFAHFGYLEIPKDNFIHWN